jgi:methylase of polypeptide subunit release factors
MKNAESSLVIEQQLTTGLAQSTLVEVLDRHLLQSTDLLSSHDRTLLNELDAAVRRIGRTTQLAANAVDSHLRAQGLAVSTEGVPDRLAFPMATLRLSRRSELASAASELRTLGYQFEADLCPAAWRAYSETYHDAAFLGKDSVLRLVLTWPISPVAKVLRRARPSLVDLSRPLPSVAWPAYLVLRVTRFVTDRISKRQRAYGLGPYLATPMSLIQPVLDLANPQRDELVVDLGCGDGRVLVDAAKRYGCRGRGVEFSPELVARARAVVAAEQLTDRIEIVQGDASDARHVEGANIVFCFLPPSSVAGLLTSTLQKIGPRGRFVAHEQLETDWPVVPDISRIIVGDAITVGHLWTGRTRLPVSR